MRRLPRYALVGLAIMLLSEALMLLGVEPFWSWHTPIAWTGYLLFVDGLVRARRGGSWLTDAPAEFAFLAIVSIPLWLVFEFYNLFIQNWHYINLPDSVFWRTFGYAWSFATIWPAIFETADLVGTVRGARAAGVARAAPPRGRRVLSGLAWASMAAGAAMLLWPIVYPSPYLAAPVWLGFIFLLEPINARLGADSMAADWPWPGREQLINLSIGGLVCGLVWECWNYWANTKWVYTVPILPSVKLFEMPLPGYLGFPAFALECFTMYALTRRLLWRGRRRAIALSSPGKTD
jgi:hypothetical protein